MDSLTILALKKAEGGGGGGDITVESLSVSQNGTYTATTGKAYSPVTVAVPQTTVSSLSVTENGTYTATTGTAYSPVVVNVSGSGGLEYETGTWTPASDISESAVNFVNAHSSPPVLVMMADSSEWSAGNNINIASVYADFYSAFSLRAPKSNSGRYGIASYVYSGTSGTLSKGAFTITSDAGDSTNIYDRSYWATNETFHSSTDSSTRLWQAGHTYKWLAVWAPTV